MLPAACHWIETERGAFLRYNAGTIAYVLKDGLTVIQSARCNAKHQAGSLAQGRRFVERWVAAGRGLPGKSHKAASRPLPDEWVFRPAPY